MSGPRMPDKPDRVTIEVPPSRYIGFRTWPASHGTDDAMSISVAASFVTRTQEKGISFEVGILTGNIGDSDRKSLFFSMNPTYAREFAADIIAAADAIDRKEPS